MGKKYYKGFNKDMTCKGFQYEEGETYHEENANLCRSGFHACENPLDCFNYYAPADSVYHEVELEEISDETGDDSKVCAKTIKIGAALDVAGICKAHFDFVKSHTIREAGRVAGDYESASAGNWGSASAGESGSASAGDRGSASAGNWGSASAGDRGSASAGDRGSASAGESGSASAGESGSASAGESGSASAGDRGSASAGDRGSASAGDRGSASAGDRGSASAGESGSASAGESGIAAALSGKVKGKMGCCIATTESDDEGNNVSCACALVDGTTVKEDTWYICKGGKLIEFKEDE